MAYSCIYIVAGPRSCGKSTFINRCREGRTGGILPTGVSGLARAHGPIYFMELGEHRPADAGELLVHVDLLSPFVGLMLSSVEELCARMKPEAFGEFPGASLFSDCSDLRVLTLCVPRIVTLHRWLGRSIELERSSVRTIMAQIYSDATGDAAYSALYDAWNHYIAGLPNAATWNVYESSGGQTYSIAPA